VRYLRLREYRNYADLELGLSPGFNVVCGPNAQGKTNLLEALYLVASAQLLRGKRDHEAIRDGSERASAEVELSETETRVGIQIERGTRKRALLNGVALPRASDVMGRLPAVAVTAEDLAIVRGDPSDRRLFLDLELSKLHPRYLRAFSQYKRALEQRNALLRDSREGMRPAEVFEPWEAQLAVSGAEMRGMRREFVEDLEAVAGGLHERMGNGESLTLDYVAADPAEDSDSLFEAMAESRTVDVARGGTSVGPHRDDVRIGIDGREARLFGSQGQQRTSVITLKMATLSTTASILGAPPLLLLDDILSDLDARRRALLVELVLDHGGQALLTCTEAEAAGERILRESAIFAVSAGEAIGAQVRRL